ncbi:MAG: DNA translocase FtsK [Bacteroidetes bacterium]|nr:DNA translocase FtsK [Bacteroidota bacterium]MBU1117111.1 DNA translocase FtsK [Bacteroidota bacterium]MBU1798642.1 DNA translocase FtsK [Bacteroidota bacterium]
MAVKKKTSKSNNTIAVSKENKKKLLGVGFIIVALLSLLSILSYSRYDVANLYFGFSDLFKIFSSDPEFVIRASSVHNWLGILGAYISNFFINYTIGYFSIVFPILMFIWGLAIIKEDNYKFSLHLSNFLLAFAIILSSLFGMLRVELHLLSNFIELSGNVGDFFGGAIGRLLGGLGSVIVLISILAISIIIAFDIKLESIFEFIKGNINDALEDDGETKITIKGDKDDSNLKKIIQMNKDEQKSKSSLFKRDKNKLEETIQTIPDEIQLDETKIRIVHKSINEEPEKHDPSLEPLEPQISKEIIIKKNDILSPKDEEDLPEPWEEKIKFIPPSLSLLDMVLDEDNKVSEAELKHNAELLKEKLLLFDIKIEDISVTPGPVVTQYEIVPAAGVKISRIVSLENDIALALAARGIRIIAPIPGKSAIGVEIPNEKSTIVRARSVLAGLKNSKAALPIALGKTIIGDIYITDLALMPHLLVAGATGSGKSVGINMLITSLLYAKHPSDVKFVIVDPKKIELSFYGKLNKHFLAISPDLDEEIITMPANALLALKSVEFEMEKRYDKLAKAGVRNIIDYNAKVNNPKTRPTDTDKIKHYKLPYIVVVIDELADLMITSGKEVEEPIARIAQLARAVGIHLVVATQRPSVNVITGVIKANFPARIAYQVATKVDSRTILDMNGAEQLLGRGDMLFLPGGMPKPIRIQNAFISTEEVEKVTNAIYIQDGYKKRYFLPSLMEKRNDPDANFLSDLDPMFEEAAQVIIRHQQGSVSLLQRKLKLGYSRAARVMDQLEQAGIVGPPDGSKAREVICESEEQLQTIIRSI